MPQLTIGKPNEKQIAFLKARNRFIAYGGARGGGKSWAVRKKAQLMALKYAGIRILILRRTFPELRENHILPMMADLVGVATWRDTDKAFSFPNSSRIRFGYCDSESDVLQYQGQEYDVIFFDEATQFTEFQFSTLCACVRGTNSFPKRVYLTCNPGGVGHEWVKRLFIDRDYRQSEDPADYLFIPARVYDNHALMENDVGYVKMLQNLPEDLRRAWLEGDWNVFAGQYFKEFRTDKHVCKPFDIPAHWRRYITLDYGLDMLACYWIALDEGGKAYVYHELYEGKDNGGDGLIISEAAKKILEHTAAQKIAAALAPPDLWNRRQETGRSAAEIFAQNGLVLTKTGNDRVAGWLAVKEWLKVDSTDEETPHMQIFATCRNLIRTIPLLQYDDKNPNDVSTTPHELTHAPDALRGFCIWRARAAKPVPGPGPVYNFRFEKPRPSALGKGSRVVVI